MINICKTLVFSISVSTNVDNWGLGQIYHKPSADLILLPGGLSSLYLVFHLDQSGDIDSLVELTSCRMISHLTTKHKQFLHMEFTIH